MASLPVIDLQPLWQDPENGINKVAADIKRIYSKIGFAYLINHQIPANTIRDIFNASQSFHQLPLQEKLKIKQNSSFRGYTPLNASKLTLSSLGQAALPNYREAFVIGPEPNNEALSNQYYMGHNQWPATLNSFQQKVEAYRDAILTLAFRLLEVISVSLGMAPFHLNQFFSPPSYWLSLQHYPSNTNKQANQFGIAPHTDYGCFTLLLQKQVSGLEVKHPIDGWISVPCLSNALVLNTGDMLNRWSNGRLLATPHRVINADLERYSVPFFFEPNMHTRVTVLSSCIDPQTPPLYPPVIYGDYFTERISHNYNTLNTHS
ncbi:2-oxoglutarate and iron-dependent oxygenase domain-containing protein [uncultured Shewanella sp.]|uniref:isopenicillin N synthase family dioxygenase n=1 Tax=uncultured Shewanella sp. TaxID=173975 RepID=UPI00263A2E6D|nr:2-oxoglutarate and iron-dependent oxygenase domain-containing protein [uncultured Shewanella sp.]